MFLVEWFHRVTDSLFPARPSTQSSRTLVRALLASDTPFPSWNGYRLLEYEPPPIHADQQPSPIDYRHCPDPLHMVPYWGPHRPCAQYNSGQTGAWDGIDIIDTLERRRGNEQRNFGIFLWCMPLRWEESWILAGIYYQWHRFGRIFPSNLSCRLELDLDFLDTNNQRLEQI